MGVKVIVADSYETRVWVAAYESAAKRGMCVTDALADADAAVSAMRERRG